MSTGAVATVGADRVKMMAQSIVNNSEVSSVGVIEWLPLVLEVLPMLFDLPCLKNKTAEQRRKWVERRPSFCKAAAARKLRDRNHAVNRTDSFEVGGQIVETIISSSDTEIREFGACYGVSC